MTHQIRSGPYRTFRRLRDHETFLEYEGSTITIPMRGRKSPQDPWMEDEVSLKAFMRLEIYQAYFNNLGTREFQFTIRDWDLYGTSPMLNRLFFDDPRGYFWTDEARGLSDYIPATVTFRVSNNYHISLDSDKIRACDIFADSKFLEIRNVTSHLFRNWVRIDERGSEHWFYTHPHHKLYFQLLGTKIISDKTYGEVLEKYAASENANESSIALKPNVPIIVFHKKAPGIDPVNDRFDIRNPEDRAKYLLGLGSVLNPDDKSGDAGKFKVINPLRGLDSNITQIHGNTVLSSHSRPLEPVEIRWALAEQLRDSKDLDELFERSGDSMITGHIRVVSPARSLGTADQGPDAGEPFDSADFPARITYAINYDIFLNEKRFVEDNAGVAIAVGAQEVPPRDVTVAFDKPHVGHVLQRYIEFNNGHCTGMHEITPEAYARGLNFARYWRTVPLDKAGRWDRFKPFDPKVIY